MKRLWFALLFLIFANNLVLAQSNPGLQFGQVPTAAQWNSYFSAKQDILGYIPLSTLGGSMLGKLTTFASSATAAGFNLPQGTAPSLPVNGDLWATSSGVYAQINGSTVGPFGTGVVGTLAVTSGGTGGATWTSGLPILGNGTSALTQGTVTGNTTEFATFTGAATSGNCVSINSAGNLQAAGGACTTGAGGGTVSAATIGQMAIYVTSTTTVGGLTTCNNGYVGTNGSGVNSCNTSLNTTLSATITAIGTIATGTWQGTTIGATYGGTGINNGSSTITLGGSVTFSGAYTFTGTLTGATSVTFPTAGTLMNQTGTSGGIPYYSSSTTIGSSSVLTANLPIFGGGAGTTPFSGTRSGNTTEVVTTTGSQTSGNCVSIDANGNHIASGAVCGTGTGTVLLNTLTASNSATLQDTTSFTNAYKFYDIVFLNIIPISNNTRCELQVQASGSFQTTGYLGNAAQTSVTTSIPCSLSTGNLLSTNNGVSGTITVFNPSNASIAPMFNGVVTFIATGPQSTSVAVGGQWNTAAAVTGFQVLMATGNIASGEIYVYGRN